jgi:hypothetical protein
MCFEGPDGAFRGIAAMAVRWTVKKFFKAVDALLLRLWKFGLKALTVSS